MAANEAVGAIEELGRYLSQMTEWRSHIHANPETAFEEVDTGDREFDRPPVGSRRGPGPGQHLPTAP